MLAPVLAHGGAVQFVQLLRIDVTHVPPAEAAARIQMHYGLPLSTAGL